MDITREELYRLLQLDAPLEMPGVNLRQSDLLWGQDARGAILAGCRSV